MLSPSSLLPPIYLLRFSAPACRPPCPSTSTLLFTPLILSRHLPLLPFAVPSSYVAAAAPRTPSVIAPLCTAPLRPSLRRTASHRSAPHQSTRLGGPRHNLSSLHFASRRWSRRRSGNWATRGDLVKSVAEIRSQRASSLAYVIERMADLEGSIFKMNMEYEGYEDRLKAMLHTLRSYKGDTKKQVEHVSKKVAGLGTLLSRVPQLLEKVESDNRETVEGVTKKISALELMLMHPEDPREGAFRHKKPAAAAARPSSSSSASSVEPEQLGSKISEIGTANVLSMAAAPKSLPGVAAGGVGGVNADVLKQARSSPSDLPQTPRDDSPDDRCARRGRRGDVCGGALVRAALRRLTHAHTHTRTHTHIWGLGDGTTPIPLQGCLSRAMDLITRAHVSLSFSLSFSHTTYHTSQTHTPTPDRSDQPSDLPQTPRIPDGKAKAGVPGQIDGKLSDDAKDITSGADLSSAASAVCEPNKRARYAKNECSVIVL